MDLGKEKYRIVLLDYPVNIIDDPFVRDHFAQIIHMKHQGYMAAYHPDVIPFDKSDFVGTHITLCKETGQALTPVFTYKSISYDRCLKHVIEFPALSLMKADGHTSCVDEVEKILKTHSHIPNRVAYDSGWAQDVQVRFNKDSVLKSFLREIFIGCVVLHHQEQGNKEIFGCGGKKVKTNLVLESIGFEPVGKNSSFFQSSLFGSEAVFFRCNEFSSFAYECAEKSKNIWKNKLVVDGRLSGVRKVA